MIFFLADNKGFNGIFKFQIIEVLKTNNDQGFKIKLLSILPMRDFFVERKKIKNAYHFSLILSMFTFLRFWSCNKFLLWFFSKKSDLIISLGILATNFNFLTKLKNCKVIYYGREVTKSEQEEYGECHCKGFENKIFEIWDYKIGFRPCLYDINPNKFF